MKIEVKNFGPIKKGTIDLDKRVTVFVGYNNSGKTYMSQLVWGAGTKNYSFEKYQSTAITDNSLSGDSLEITKEILDNLMNEFSDKLSEVILPDWFRVDKSYFKNKNFSLSFIGSLIDAIKKEELEVIVVHNNNNPPFDHIGYSYVKKPANSLIFTSEVKSFDKGIDSASLYRDYKQLFTGINSYFSNYGKPDNKKTFLLAITSFIQNILFNQNYLPFFLPANRLFFPGYFKYIYSVARAENNLINTNIKHGGNIETIRNLTKVPYTVPVDILIDRFWQLNNGLVETNYYNKLLNELQTIIGGEIVAKSIESIGQIEFYLKLKDGEELDMYMSSSSANQLTTFYLYLKYWAQEKNNYLIIDEPEENLHPENQIRLVNILMKFADMHNNKVLITTHSPLITDHINNYANLSYLKESGTDVSSMVNDEFTHMADIQTIKHGDYGVYFFNGSEIEEYEVGNYGAYFEDFQKAENKVKETSNALKNSIYDNINDNARKSFQNKSK